MEMKGYSTFCKSTMAGASLSDGLMSYTGHSLATGKMCEKIYWDAIGVRKSTEMQSVYSTAPGYWDSEKWSFLKNVLVVFAILFHIQFTRVVIANELYSDLDVREFEP